MKRKFISLVISYTIVLYAIICMIKSIEVAENPDRAYDLITNRAPFIVLESVTSSVSVEDGQPYGITSDGFFLAYSPSQGFTEGDRVTTVMMWNPLNNSEDDIVARYDMKVGG